MPDSRPVAGSGARDILQNVFGFSDFRTGQADAIDALLAGQNVLAVMPTGAGKSLCFQVPALMRPGFCVVVSPLVALMQDQVAALRLSGIQAAAINSSVERSENVETWNRLAAGDIKLLYLSPERLMTPRMLEALSRLRPAFFAIDEAHCISQWGPAFRPEYEGLKNLAGLFPGTPAIALTATADPATRDDIVAKMFGGEARMIVTGFDRPNLHLAVERKHNAPSQMLDFLETRRGQSGIIYCLSRKSTEQTAAMLNHQGYDALAYHAGMDAPRRAAHQDRFMTDAGVIMVATIAFGMGIDKPDIRFVFHADLPGGPEAYYQEIGRAGRDGAPADVLMLYGLKDIGMRRGFIENEDAGPERKRREHQRLTALLAYCEAATCRRRLLMAYFGETVAPCGYCDVCENPADTVDGAEAGQMALSAVHRTGQRFGAAHIVDVVRGAATEKIRQFGHDRLPTYGVGADKGAREWQGIVRQLVAAGFLGIDIQGYGALRITDLGRQLLKGQADFRYRPDLAASGAAKKAKKAKAPPPELAPASVPLLAHLKQLRLQLAKAQDVPAYVIFSDKTLIDMAGRQPRDEAAFGEVFGVGEAKRRAFAEPFLAAIAAFTADA